MVRDPIVDHVMLWQMPIRYRVDLESFGSQLLWAARGRAGVVEDDFTRNVEACLEGQTQ